MILYIQYFISKDGQFFFDCRRLIFSHHQPLCWHILVPARTGALISMWVHNDHIIYSGTWWSFTFRNLDIVSLFVGFTRLISQSIVFSSHNKPVPAGLISPETNQRTGWLRATSSYFFSSMCFSLCCPCEG